MRQDEYFAAHFELLQYGTPESLWGLIPENKSEKLNLEQNVSTKSKKVAWVWIVPESHPLICCLNTNESGKNLSES